MLSAGFPQSAAAGRDALDTFMKDNLYKYDVIIMKDTDTGAQTYIVADRGPAHPVRNGSRDGQKNNARGGERKTTKVIRESMTNSHGGLQNLDGFVHSVNDAGSPVKGFSKRTIDIQQFKRWFGDWQNDPAKASKVVNADGTPKVVYHGTNAELKAEYLKQVVQIQKKHHLPESAAVLPVTALIHRRTGPAYRGPHGRRRRARAGR